MSRESRHHCIKDNNDFDLCINEKKKRKDVMCVCSQIWKSELLNLMQHPMRCLVFKHEGEIVVSGASLETLALVRRGWWCCDSISGRTTGGGVSEVCGGAV